MELNKVNGFEGTNVAQAYQQMVHQAITARAQYHANNNPAPQRDLPNTVFGR